MWVASNYETKKSQGTDRSGCSNSGHFIKDRNETDEKRAVQLSSNFPKKIK